MYRVVFVAALGTVVGCTFAPAHLAAPVEVDAAPDASDSERCLARWHDGSVMFGSAEPLRSLNAGSASDRDPFLPDELTIYFASDRPGGQETDVYTATRATAADDFSPPVLAPAFNSPSNDTKMSMSADGTIAVVSSDRTGSVGGADVWYSTRATADGTFAPFAQTNMINVNTTGSEYDPQLSGDGLRLYFAPAGATNQEIAVATRATVNDPFGVPVLLSVDAPPSNAADPALSADESVIVFSSNRDPAGTTTLVDGNMWFATRTGNTGDFGAPIEIPNVNTTSAEGDPVLSPDACTLYFSSTRDETDGTWDLWVAKQLLD